MNLRTNAVKALSLVLCLSVVSAQAGFVDSVKGFGNSMTNAAVAAKASVATAASTLVAKAGSFVPAKPSFLSQATDLKTYSNAFGAAKQTIAAHPRIAVAVAATLALVGGILVYNKVNEKQSDQ